MVASAATLATMSKRAASGKSDYEMAYRSTFSPSRPCDSICRTTIS